MIFGQMSGQGSLALAYMVCMASCAPLLDGRLAWLEHIERRFWGQCPGKGYPNYRATGSGHAGIFLSGEMTSSAFIFLAGCIALGPNTIGAKLPPAIEK